MSRLDDLKPGATVKGILTNGLVTVVNVHWHGSEALELTYKSPEGKVANELLYRHDEPRIAPAFAASTPDLDAEDVEDLEEAPENEVEAAEEEILDQATAARSIAELRIEIETLKRLEALALAIRRSGEDKKWRELATCRTYR